MSLTKKYLKNRPHCKVKFCLEKEQAGDSQQVFLVGEFNEWSESGHPMKKARDGSFSLEVELPVGHDFRFRYLLDSGEWANDLQADAYAPCPFAGVENSVVKV